MKKVLLSLLVAGTGLLSAQVVSFEQSEGFFPGDLNGQVEEWSITGDGAGGFISGQNVTDAMSSDGSQSFHNAEVMEYGPQENIVIGGFYNPSEVIPFASGFTVSYDFYGTEWDALNTSDFMFGIADLEAGFYITQVYFSYDGSVLFTGLDEMGVAQAHPTTGTWTTNTWHNIRLEYDGLSMSLYLDNELISSGAPFDGGSNVDHIRLVHDNYGGDAYYDNIRINDTASTNDIASTKSVSAVYPNPAKDVVNIKLANDFNAAKTLVTVTNVSGKKVASFDSVNKVNVANLPAGVYILTITDGTKTETKKLIKK
ncbi:T9SS type A sorting domain-containing protein [Weeksellaceae bacterium KMM 9713]|uniref:T9SS type A sorting domain-containing protein n=1 Tax=Profundicola chukchiensis TaxID=2961959 RepID=A0A9X4MVF3_9FLAO|nr:T9SS type A sorting domain-containing protein [Profundicola chukchiensis]MDG4945548.1 T9SS type A sorting domain-containing protein [Profundicola chukchiensis]